MKGLLVRDPWIGKIFKDGKIWEIRGSRTFIRGKIALIRSGSGLIIGTCELVDVIGPLSLEELINSFEKHRVPVETFKHNLPYKRTFAWVFKNSKMFERPVPYKHPNGAVIWVNLPDL